MSAGGASAHAVPFYCPYCGEEPLEPVGDAAGGWGCRDCRREFTLRAGVRPAGGSAHPPARIEATAEN